MRVELSPAFIDARGSIQNIVELLAHDRPIRGAAIIRSAAGSERSNHWHREDGHYLYVLSGEMHYWECSALYANEPLYLPEPGIFKTGPLYPPEPSIFKTGDCVFTGRYLWHRTRFPVESTLLSLSFLPRDTASHERDVVR